MLTLEVSSDRPTAVPVRAPVRRRPAGASLRVTYGLLNLTHRDSHERPEPLEPGRRYAVRLQLNDTHAFLPGHRIRLALDHLLADRLALAQVATVTVFTAGSRLSPPVRAPRPEEDAALRPFPPAESAPLPEARTMLRPGRFERTFGYDVATDTMTYTSLAILAAEDRCDRPGARGDRAQGLPDQKRRSPLRRQFHRLLLRRGRGDWQVRTDTRTRMRATREHFPIDAELDAYEDERRVFSRNWHARIPRDLV